MIRLPPALRVEVDGSVATVTVDRPPVKVIADQNPLAVRQAKTSLNRSEYLGAQDVHRVEQDYTARLKAVIGSSDRLAAGSQRRQSHP